MISEFVLSVVEESVLYEVPCLSLLKKSLNVRNKIDGFIIHVYIFIVAVVFFDIAFNELGFTLFNLCYSSASV